VAYETWYFGPGTHRPGRRDSEFTFLRRALRRVQELAERPDVDWAWIYDTRRKDGKPIGVTHVVKGRGGGTEVPAPYPPYCYFLPPDRPIRLPTRQAGSVEP